MLRLNWSHSNPRNSYTSQGCRVVGSAGTDEKVKYIKDLGFDEAFNYKTTPNLYAKLKELAPKRIDVYFDNVSVLLSRPPPAPTPMESEGTYAHSPL